MTVRIAKISDLDELNKFYRMLLEHEMKYGDFHYCTNDLIRSRLETYKQILGDKNLGFILIYEEKNKIIGMLVAQYGVINEQDLPLKKPVFIYDVFVLPTCRRKGVGRLIFDKALSISRKDDRDVIHAIVSVENEPVNIGLESYGFKNVYFFKSLKL